MTIVNIIVDTLGIMVLVSGIALGLKALYAFISQSIKKYRARIPKKSLDTFNENLRMIRLEGKLEDLEKRVPTSRKLKADVRKTVRDYLKELAK